MSKFSKILQKLKVAGEWASDAFFPNDIKCISCGEELAFDTEYGLCNKCELPLNTTFCSKCGANTDGKAILCENCKQDHREFEFARSPLRYKDKTVEIIRRYKFGSKKYLAPFLARFMADCYFQNDYKVDIATFVPLHPTKLKQRGFNQAEQIAIHLCEYIGLDLIDYFDKVIQHQDTARLNRTQRMSLVKSSFVLKPYMAEFVNGRSILLIDDVITTGATANHLTQILKENGATNVYVITIASGSAWVNERHERLTVEELLTSM